MKRLLAFFLIGMSVFAAAGWWLDQRSQTFSYDLSQTISYDLSQAEHLRSAWLRQARRCDHEAILALRSENELEMLYDDLDAGVPESLIMRADEGDAEAVAILAIYNYAYGDESVSDVELGAILLQAAEGGSPTAQNEVGNAALFGEFGIPQNPEIAQYWLLQAAQQGEHLAMANLARAYQGGMIDPVETLGVGYGQAAADAALMASSRCDHFGLFISSIMLNNELTEPYDPETAAAFRELVPVMPQRNYLEEEF